MKKKIKSLPILASIGFAMLLGGSFTTSSILRSSRPASAAPTCGAGDIGGTVFEDFNANSVQDTGDPAVPGILVTAYDSTDAMVGTATTDALGDWTISVGTGADVRVEFSGVPSYYETGVSSPVGAQSETSVVFINQSDVDSCDVDYTVSRPGRHCQSDPQIATTCFVNNDRSIAPTDPSVVTFDYSDGGTTNPVHQLEGVGDTGSLWGVAYDRVDGTLFTSAVLRRHADLGPSGIDAVYPYNYSDGVTATPLPAFTLSAVTGDPYTNPRPISALPNTNLTDPSHDHQVYDHIGKLGIGSISISDDGGTLYVVDLEYKRIVVIDVSNPSSPTLVENRPVADPGCVNGVHQLWASQVYNDELYIGVTCDASTATIEFQPSDMVAYVLRYDTGSSSFVVVDLDASTASDYVALDYERSCSTRVTGTDGAACDATLANADTYNWLDDWATNNWATEQGAQLLLSDFEFDDDGSLILSFMDRNGLRWGYANYVPDPAELDTTTNNYSIRGELLRLCNSGGNYYAEGHANCPLPTVHDSDPTTAGSVNQGPGGNEWYDDNVVIPAGPGLVDGHDEAAMGALSLLPGSGQVVATMMDPGNTYFSGGTKWYTNNTGTSAGDYTIYDNVSAGAYIGKAVGLGDITLLCNAAPIEIGNRAWFDTDRDGKQDAGEAPVVGVTVNLYDATGSALIASTTTDANGSYYFSSDNGGSYSLNHSTNYTIRIDEASDFQSGGVLEGYGPTLTDSVADTFDNDSSLVNSYPQVSFATLGAGANNHSYDFGFVTQADFSLNKSVSTLESGSVSPGDDITWTIQVVNEGAVDGYNITLIDYLPSGLSLSPNDTNGWVASGDAVEITLANPVVVGSSTNIDIVTTLSNSFSGTTLDNFAEITEVRDIFGNVLGDIDSTPDATAGDTSEDDYDGATINVIGAGVGNLADTGDNTIKVLFVGAAHILSALAASLLRFKN